LFWSGNEFSNTNEIKFCLVFICPTFFSIRDKFT